MAFPMKQMAKLCRSQPKFFLSFFRYLSLIKVEQKKSKVDKKLLIKYISSFILFFFAMRMDENITRGKIINKIHLEN